jgi:hypothetical protein
MIRKGCGISATLFLVLNKNYARIETWARAAHIAWPGRSEFMAFRLSVFGVRRGSREE